MTDIDWAQLMDDAKRAGFQQFTVGVVIRRGPRILILKRRPDDFMPNLWEVPGGHVDVGESIPDAARRELLEETGLVLERIVRLVNAFDYPGELGPTHEWNVEAIVSEAWTDQPPREALVYPEHADAAWVEQETLPQFPMTPDMRHLLELAFQDPL